MTFEIYQDFNFRPKTLAVIKQANTIIDDLQAQGFTLTLRQLYYQFVSRGWIENTQRSYDSLGAVVSKGRLAGLISWGAIEDITRFLRGPIHHLNPRFALFYAANTYRRDKWDGAPTRIEVWIEKDALVGVIKRACDEVDVRYFSCRGYVSLSTMYEAGKRFLTYDDAEDIIVIHLGDHDPSGIDMTRDIQDRLNMFAEGRVTVERIALNMDQIEEFSPPPNPAKLTDSRADQYIRQHGYDSWELDALRPQYIEELIRGKVLAYRDEAVWDKNVERQEKDQRTLHRIAEDQSDR